MHSFTGQALPKNVAQDSASSEQNTTQTKTCYQAVGADGIPLCLFCSSPVEFAARLRCSDWDQRFCSHDCKKEYQVINFFESCAYLRSCAVGFVGYVSNG